MSTSDGKKTVRQRSSATVSLRKRAVLMCLWPWSVITHWSRKHSQPERIYFLHKENLHVIQWGSKNAVGLNILSLYFITATDYRQGRHLKLQEHPQTQCFCLGNFFERRLKGLFSERFGEEKPTRLSSQAFATPPPPTLSYQSPQLAVPILYQ